MRPTQSSVRNVVTAITAATLAAAWAIPCRAALYGYAVQQTTGYTFTGATAGTISMSSSSSASQNASPSGSDAHSGTNDALESYVGPAAGKPPENTFTPKGQTTPDYSRGDAAFGAAAFGTNNVAELDLDGGGNASGAGSWAATVPVTVTTGGALTVTLAYTNQLALVNTGSPAGTVQASYSWNFTLQNSASTVVFSSSPSALNLSAGLTSIGTTTIPGSGTVAVTTGALAAGTYNATFTGTETVFANAVPEPAAGGGLALLALGAARRNRRHRAG
jgi:hypothetical protein